MENIEICRARREHEDKIHALFHRAMAAGGAPSWEDDEFGYPFFLFQFDIVTGALAALKNGEVVAYAHYEFDSPWELDFVPWKHDSDYCYFARLTVDPALRGRGLGSWFLSQLFSRAKAIGAKYGRFVVYPTNVDALRLYDRLGYTRVGEYDSPWAEFDEGRIVVFETEL